MVLCHAAPFGQKLPDKYKPLQRLLPVTDNMDHSRGRANDNAPDQSHSGAHQTVLARVDRVKLRVRKTIGILASVFRIPAAIVRLRSISYRI